MDMKKGILESEIHHAICPDSSESGQIKLLIYFYVFFTNTQRLERSGERR